MGFFFSGMFWGAILILIGISVILKHVLHIDFPLFRFLMGAIFIIIGIQIFLGKPIMGGAKNYHQTIFAENEMTVSEEAKDYSTVFGKSIIHIPAGLSPDKKYEINTIFGNTEVFLEHGVNADIKMNAVFGAVQNTEGDVVAFGSMNRSVKSGKNAPIRIEANAVFGNIEFKMKQ